MILHKDRELSPCMKLLGVHRILVPVNNTEIGSDLWEQLLGTFPWD